MVSVSADGFPRKISETDLSRDTTLHSGFAVSADHAAVLDVRPGDFLILWRDALSQSNDRSWDGGSGIILLVAACKVRPTRTGDCAADDQNLAMAVHVAAHQTPLGASLAGWRVVAVPACCVPLAHAAVLVCSPGNRTLLRDEEAAVTGALTASLLEERRALRDGCSFEWVPGGLPLQVCVRAHLKLAGKHTEGEMPRPSDSWMRKDWFRWLQLLRVGLLVEVSSVRVTWEAEDIQASHIVKDPMSLLAVEEMRKRLRSVLHHKRNIAVILGSADFSLVLQALRAHCAVVGARLAVRSADTLSESAAWRGMEPSLSVAQHLVAEMHLVPTVMVLVKPNGWFTRGAEAFASVFQSMLEMHEMSQVVGAEPCGTSALVSLFDTAIPKGWDNLVDETVCFDKLTALELRARSVSGEFQLERWQGVMRTAVSTEHSGSLPRWLVSAAEAIAMEDSRAQVMLLLHGPPGSGKTSALNAVPLSPFNALPLQVSRLIHAGVGETPAAVRNHFVQAWHRRPCCVTLDDVDELFGSISGTCAPRELLNELVLMIDRYCSPQLLFVASCTVIQRVPSCLACRLHVVNIEVPSSHESGVGSRTLGGSRQSVVPAVGGH